MRVKSTIVALLFVVSLIGGAMAADTYKLDLAHTHIGFAVKHMVISTVRGDFKEFEGTIAYDESDITKSSVEVTIKTASINTGNERRDNHLKSAEFFDVEKYPAITFKSKAIKKTDDGFVAVGDLTIHGVTKEVEVPFQFSGKITDPWGNTRIGAEGALTINRQDFGISWNNKLDNGGLVVGNDVKIEFSLEAIKQSS